MESVSGLGSNELELTANRGAVAAPGSRPTVLHVLGPSTGGIRRHVAELVRQTDSLGWRGVVAGPAGVMDGVGRQDVTISAAGAWSATAMVGIRQRLRQQVRSADVVHAHGIKAAAIASTIGGRAPLVVTLHNDMVGTHAGALARLRRVLQGALLRRADHVVFVSNGDAERNRSPRAAERRSVIMSFAATPAPTAARAHTRRELGIDEGSPLVAVVARLHPQKDLGMFLHAFGKLLDDVPHARAVVAGDGPQRCELERICATLGLADAVRFLGATDHAADLIVAADVVAISSRWEAGPIVAVEAMQLGTPVVMTRSGAVAELAARSAAAAIVAPGDTEAFASELVSLLSDDVRRETLAARGRALAAAEFDPSVLVHRTDALYRGLLSRSARGRRRSTVAIASSHPSGGGPVT